MKLLKLFGWFIVLAVGFLGGVAWKEKEPQKKEEVSPVVSPVSDEKEASTASAYEAALNQAEKATIRLFEESAPSVCFITTTKLRRDFFSTNVHEIPKGSGSGFIWDQSGNIITNFHVIQGASRAKITLADHSTWDATLVGAAPEKDLAVLHIDAPAERLKAIPIGSSSDLKVGQSVLAIGNPFGLDQTLTTGIVSALGREIKSVSGLPIRGAIQTDAAINPGNSGGPLLDSSGRLIGVNTSIYSPSGASAGIGFSIPVDVLKWVVPDLIEYGEVNRPSLGVEFARPLRNVTGALVYDVIPNSPAEAAGIRPTRIDNRGQIYLGDIIVAVEGEKITSSDDVILALEKHQVGEEIEVTILREGKEHMVKIELIASK